MGCVLQGWIHGLPMMQQTVLLTAIRGPDGIPKYGPAKMLLRWYRRCILLSAMDQRVIGDPMQEAGGSFTGPSIAFYTLLVKASARLDARCDFWSPDFVGPEYEAAATERVAISSWPIAKAIEDQEREDGWEPLMHEVVGQYLRELDAIPHHFQLHLLHAIEILGYKHPTPRIRRWWLQTYERLVHDMHLWPETEEQMDLRLGDDRAQWLARADPATVA